MLKRLMRGGAAAGLLAVLVACAHPAGSVPATRDALLAVTPPSTPAGWRITQVLPDDTIGGLWADGTRDAWLAGDACANLATCGVSDTSNGTVVVRHWDGASWQAVKPPKAYVNTPLDQGAGPVAGTSASNVWIAAYRGAQSIDWTDMLHWTGSGWAAPVRLPSAIQAAVAPSATQLWAFGDGAKLGQSGYVAHFTGTAWIRGSFPLAGTAAAALSPADVWVGGNTSAGALGIEHWDGHQWRATTLPGLGLSHSALPGLTTVVGIAIIKPDDVWAVITTVGGANPRGVFLLRWNGSAWARAPFPYAGIAFSPATPDGYGGLWLVLAASNKELWFCHYSAGQWTRTPVPRTSGEQPQVQNLAWIPGTHSLWAVGGVSFAGNGTAILKYGT
jgi:hypothetical protein